MAAFGTQFKPGLVLPGARVRKIAVERNELQGYCRIADGSHDKVSYFPPRYIRKQKILNLPRIFTIEFASGVRLKIRYLHREEWKTESKSISNPSSWLWLRKTSDQWHKLEAIRCCNSRNIAKHWFEELPNRQHLPERWKMDKLYHQRICCGRKRFYF